MNIGILTYHRAYNFGAILQAYALQKKLYEMGYNSEIIDYLSVEKRKTNQLFRFDKELNYKNNLIKFLKDIYRTWKNQKFDSFIKSEMVLSPTSYSTYEEMENMDLENRYDVYIVGSDQVWNINNNKRDKAYLLTFCKKNYKKCSYAASVGNAEFDADMHEMYMKELGTFRILTVREQSAIEKYDFLSVNNARVCLDPTLLLYQENYIKIATKKLINKKYAFLYTIEEDRNLREYAKRFCENNNLLLIDSKRSIEFFLNSSPRNFISFILYSDYVFTNSFHGTVFSIILHKKFATEVNTKHRLNNRSFDLMNTLGLTSRDIDQKDFNIKEDINYESVDDKIAFLRQKSIDVLHEIIRI